MPPRRARERTRLVGRTDEITAVREAFAGARLVTLHGPPGVGKTRLALRFADLAEREGRAVVFVELGEARSAADVAAAVAIALGVPLGPAGRAAAAEVGEALASRGALLLVLDEIEHVTAHAEATVFAWLDAAPDLCVLTTSRERIAAPGERTLPITPLPPGAAEELFLERARAVRPAYEPAGDELSQVTALVERLDRLPLAIEIAADRISVLSPGEMVRRLDEGVDAILDEPGRRGARRVTMREAIAWSWALLGAAEQDAWAQCSVFHGGFDLAAAEAVVNLVRHPDAPKVSAVIAALCRQALLVSDDTPGGGSRLYSYEVLQSFAAERLREGGGAEVAAERHARYYVALAEDAARGAPYGASREELGRLRRERDNLLSAFRFCLASRPALALRAAAALDPLLLSQGPHETHVEVLEAALALPESAGDEGARADVIRSRGRLHALVGEQGKAEGALLAALAIARKIGDRTREADALGFVGYVHRALGRLDEARADVLAARQIAQDLGDRLREAAAERILGQIATSAGERRAAADHFRTAAALARRAEVPRLSALALLNLADARRDEGALADARAALAEAAALLEAIDDQVHRVKVAVREGALLRAEGRSEEAEVALRGALAAARAVRDAQTEAAVEVELSALALDRGDARAAGRHADEAGAILRHIEEPALEARVRRLLLWIAADAGDVAAVPREAARAEEAARRAADRRLVQEARCAAAVTATDPHAARAQLAALADELGPDASPRLGAIVLAHLALLEASIGRADVAGATLSRARAALGEVEDEEARAVVRAVERALASDLGGDGAPPRHASLRCIARIAARRTPSGLIVEPEGRAFMLGARRVDLGRRGALRRVLAALAEQRIAQPGVGLPVREIVRVGWPGERMSAESATARVYMAVRTLRSLGLEGLLLTRDDGYLLDPAVAVEIASRV
ncbi:MAG: AAA family ATPase [Minicystis sp.]